MEKTAYLFDPVYLEHDTGLNHPECPARLDAIHRKIKAAPYYSDLLKIQSSVPDLKHIELIHSKEYIKRIKDEIESGIPYIDTMDNPVCRESYKVALHAVGGSLNMCDAIMTAKAINGFCAVRPPGHHAERDYAAGFCFFNNIAISAKYLQSVYGLKKIAIIDWDVHHGNGTQHSFEKDPSVLYVSLHQFPLYPGSGAETETGYDKGREFTLNLPMHPGSSDDEYKRQFTERIIPELENFAPEIILISAGFDAHYSDIISSIKLSTEIYYDFTIMLMKVAEKYSNKKIIAFLEGGYNLKALADCVNIVIKAFTGA